MDFISDTLQIIIFSKFADGVKYLLLKRSELDDVYPSIWQVCTGTREEHEKPLEALHRELLEETGINSYINLWNVPYVASYHSLRRNAICFSPVFALEVDPNVEIKISNEHTDYCWQDYDTAINMLFIPSYRQSLTIVKDFILNPKSSHLFLIK